MSRPTARTTPTSSSSTPADIREKAAEKVYSELGRLRKAQEEAGRSQMVAVAGCETHSRYGVVSVRSAGSFRNMLDAQRSATTRRSRSTSSRSSTATEGTSGRSLPKLTQQKEARQVAHKLKKGGHYASPVFDGAPEEAIKKSLTLAGLLDLGQAVLFDGRTGEAFDQEVTVGVMYVLKLHHLVDDKIPRARSVRTRSSPSSRSVERRSSAVSVSAKWKSGRWRPTERRYALQEFLTVKSDDVPGRTRMYEAIVKGEYRSSQASLSRSTSSSRSSRRSASTSSSRARTGPRRRPGRGRVSERGASAGATAWLGGSTLRVGPLGSFCR